MVNFTVDQIKAGRYPYKVFFRATADVIEILAIRHTSRLPDLE